MKSQWTAIYHCSTNNCSAVITHMINNNLGKYFLSEGEAKAMALLPLPISPSWNTNFLQFCIAGKSTTLGICLQTKGKPWRETSTCYKLVDLWICDLVALMESPGGSGLLSLCHYASLWHASTETNGSGLAGGRFSINWLSFCAWKQGKIKTGIKSVFY